MEKGKWVKDGWLPKRQRQPYRDGAVYIAGHPRHIAIYDKPGGKMILCVAPSASDYGDLKKHVTFLV